ncbi:tryptophan-rich sensory protein [Candidatus Woesearchaeota archaeon]|nr:tryptophan-rich sensory protein [Candidatus Woesearchaeota archaeon]
MKLDLKKAGKLIGAIVLCHLAGLFGSLFTAPAIDSWYAGLVRPEFSPPNWIFAPVWLTLYTLMGISLYLVLEVKQAKQSKQKNFALGVFGIQLFLNAIWSYLFFGLQLPLYGLICIIALWIIIALMIFAFYKIKKTAAYLQLPYIIWVSIATALNYFIWVLN